MRLTTAAIATALAAVAFLLLSSSIVGPSVGAPVAPSLGRAGPAYVPLAMHAAKHPAPPYAPPTSGTGTFVTSVPMPPNLNTTLCTGPNITNRRCGSANVSTDPAVTVLRSNGEIAVAYTAYTNQSLCGANWTLTQVAFTYSKDNGTTWSTPIYLGNTQCDLVNESRFANSWEPTITSLPNGTIVLAFTEWSEIYQGYQYGYNYAFPELNPIYSYGYGAYQGTYNWSRIVVERSFDGGTLWTSPQVLNQSTFDPTVGFSPYNGSAAWVDENPTIASSGNTVYLAWQNSSQELYENFVSYPYYAIGDTGVQFVSSTDGGTTWSNQSAFPVLPGNQSLVAANPALLTSPSGEVFAAYVTNTTYGLYCQIISGSNWCYYTFHGTPIVGSSLTNGTSWNWTDLPTQSLEDYGIYPYYYAPWHISLQPQLAFDPTRSVVSVAFANSEWARHCSPYCYLTEEWGIAIASSNLTAWQFTPHFIPQLTAGENQTSQGAFSTFLSPSIEYTPNGTLYLAVTYYNESMAMLSPYGYYWYGAFQELLTSSTDDGATFAPPLVAIAPSDFETEMPMGSHGAMLTQGNAVSFLWVDPVCPAYNTSYYYYCYWSTGSSTMNASSILEYSQIFNGTGGVTVDFNESGLPTGIPWSVSLQGNARASTAPTNLSVSGVPTHQSLEFSVSNYTTSNTRYFASISIASPVTFTGNTTIYVNYTKQYLVVIKSNPSYPLAGYPYNSTPYCYIVAWGAYCPSLNYNISGSFGSLWLDNGSKVSTNVSLLQTSQYHGYTYCTGCWYQLYNLTFLSWTGTGTNSVTTTGTSISLTVTGPVTEVANFQFNAYCEWTNSPSFNVSCAPSFTNFTFAEHGLTNGTAWGVELYGTGTNQTTPYVATTTASVLLVHDPALTQTAYYLPLTVAGPGGTIYTAEGTPASPVQLPGSGPVVLDYTARSTGTGALPSLVEEVGLPGGTAWSYDVGGVGNASGSSAPLALDTAALGTSTITASPVYLTGGVGYYVSAIDVLPLTVGGAWTNVTDNATTVNIESSMVIVYVYALQFELAIASSVGGTATPGTAWVHGNATVVLNATALPGYFFVAWSGTGLGSVNASTPGIRVTVGGPVRELATFEVNPAVRYFPTVVVAGLPASALVRVGFNGSYFVGNGTFRLPSVLPGAYNFSVAPVLANGTTSTEYVPTHVSSSFPAGTGATYEIATNGTITVTYSTQYTLTVVAGADGTASPIGSTWQTSGSQVAVTASPYPGFEVVGWVGNGTGAQSAGNASGLTVTMGGPITETVTFQAIPPSPPRTYTLTVTETGLAPGTSWSVTVNGSGNASTTSALTVAHLRGVYTLAIAAVPGATPGAQFAPSVARESINLTSGPLTVAVTFGMQYWLQISSTSGGTVTPHASGWYAAGSEVAIDGVADSNYALTHWNGTGAGSYSGDLAAATIWMNGSITEFATFGPVTSSTQNPQNAGTSTSGLPLDLGLLAALLVAGLLLALLLGRRRREAPPAEPVPMATWDDGAPANPAWDGDGAAGGTSGPEPPTEGA